MTKTSTVAVEAITPLELSYKTSYRHLCSPLLVIGSRLTAQPLIITKAAA